jgi:hypothetical protein
MARDRHLTNIHGGGNAMRTLQVETKKAEFNAFSQKPSVSKTDFKNQFDSKLLIMEGMGKPRPEESQLAMNFLMRLDSSRYEDMMTSLTNAAARDIPFPNTL